MPWRDRLKAHHITRCEERCGNAIRVKDLEPRPSDDLPSSRRLTRVNPGLPTCETNRARGNTEPWRLTPRRCNLGVDGPEIGKAGEKSQHEYTIFRARVSR